MKVAAIQMVSTIAREANLARAPHQLAPAAAPGAPHPGGPQEI